MLIKKVKERDQSSWGSGFIYTVVGGKGDKKKAFLFLRHTGTYR